MFAGDGSGLRFFLANMRKPAAGRSQRLNPERSPAPFESIASRHRAALTHVLYRLLLRQLSLAMSLQRLCERSQAASTITAVLTPKDETVKIFVVIVEILLPRFLAHFRMLPSVST